MRTKQIKIHRTEGEWRELEKLVLDTGKGDMKSFLRREILTLAKRLNECEKCVSNAEGEMIEKRFYISAQSVNILEAISERMKKPVGSVINDIIISRLLHNRKSPS